MSRLAAGSVTGEQAIRGFLGLIRFGRFPAILSYQWIIASQLE
jgi:hypothetical protein